MGEHLPTYPRLPKRGYTGLTSSRGEGSLDPSPCEAMKGDRAGVWDRALASSLPGARGCARPVCGLRKRGRKWPLMLTREQNPRAAKSGLWEVKRITRSTSAPSKHTAHYPRSPDETAVLRIPPQPLHRRRARRCGCSHPSPRPSSTAREREKGSELCARLRRDERVSTRPV